MPEAMPQVEAVEDELQGGPLGRAELRVVHAQHEDVPFRLRAVLGGVEDRPGRNLSAKSTPVGGWYENEPCMHTFVLKFHEFSIFTDVRKYLKMLNLEMLVKFTSNSG